MEKRRPKILGSGNGSKVKCLLIAATMLNLNLAAESLGQVQILDVLLLCMIHSGKKSVPPFSDLALRLYSLFKKTLEGNPNKNLKKKKGKKK